MLNYSYIWRNYLKNLFNHNLRIMKKIYLLVATLLSSVGVFAADWIHPADPTAQKLETGKEYYLFNIKAKGFLVGANDWGTRASYSSTLGHKVIIEQGEGTGSYYITNFVLQGGMANQWGYMFMDSEEAIYVDNTKTGKTNNQYTFVDQGSYVYRIGLSDLNATLNPTTLPDAWIGGNPYKNDTRLYICEPENANGYSMDDCQLDWIFATSADYEKYIVDIAQYNAAVALGDAIKEAKGTAGTDAAVIATAEKVYEDKSSSTDVLNAQTEAVKKTIRMAKYNIATKDAPVEVLALQDIATDFSSGATGWTSNTGAQNKGADNGNNAADFSKTGNHYENWNPSPFTPGKISATVKDIPAGVYEFSANAFTNTGKDAYLFAANNEKAVTSTQIVQEETFNVFTIIPAGELSVGLDIPTKGPGWVGLDNAQLMYYGTSADAIEMARTNILNEEPDYETNIEEGTAGAQADIKKTYFDAKQAFENAKDINEVATAAVAFSNASIAMRTSAAAYGKYIATLNKVNEWLMSTSSESDEVILLGDYIEGSVCNEGEFNGNGGAAYILSNSLLNEAQIEAENAYLEKILNDAMANAMNDGDDCTAMLKNPDFKEEGGWTAAAGIDWPKGKDIFPVFEAWNRVADVYQTLSGMQNGIYELSLNGAFRRNETANDGDNTNAHAYAYLNDFEVKVPAFSSEIGNIGSCEDASDLFADGKYAFKVYGLVTDGTLKVGITNKLRAEENCWLVAGGVKLTFRSKNAEACANLLNNLTEQAKAVKELHIGKTELEDLEMAIFNAEGLGDEDGYKALVALKKSLDAANTSAELYTSLNTAIENLKDAIDNNPDASSLADAKILYDSILESYNGKALSNKDAEQAISDANAASVALKMGSGVATEDEPVDYTKAIVNNTFDPDKGSKDEKRIDGWAVSGALNGYKQNSCSFNKGTFDLHQNLSGLPAGKYKVTVHTYYRAGSYEEEEANIINGKDTHLMKLYANDKEANIMNLSEGAKGQTLPDGIGTKVINGITVPDGTGNSVACFNAGLYLNELEFTVGEDGKATIGLKLDQVIGTNDYTVIGEWNLYYYGNSEISEKDVTKLIVNNNFDPEKGSKDDKRIDGWAVSGALNGYKQNSCSFNKGTFDLHQDFSGLPEGTYKATVHTYYRAGSYEEEEANIINGKDTHLMKMYANTSEKNYETNIMNLSEGAKGQTLPDGIGTKVINGITVPDGTGNSVACFNAGLYLNEIVFHVGKDGKATIGLKLDQVIGTNDYTVIGEWNLYYYGNGNNVDTVVDVEDITSDAEAVPVAYYSTSGIRLAEPQKGINIVKMSNGTSVVKIMK